MTNRTSSGPPSASFTVPLRALAVLVWVLACSSTETDVSTETDAGGQPEELADLYLSDPPHLAEAQGGAAGGSLSAGGTVVGGFDGARMDVGFPAPDEYSPYKTGRAGDTIFVATAGGRLTAVDLDDVAAPRVRARTWTHGVPRRLVALDDTLVSVELIGNVQHRARTRIASWPVDTGDFAEPSIVFLDGPVVAVVPVGERLLVATVGGVTPGGMPYTEVRSFGRVATGRIASGAVRTLPHFFEAGEWVVPRLVAHESTLWAASPSRSNGEWQTRFNAFDASDEDLPAVAWFSEVVVAGVFVGGDTIAFEPDGFTCLTRGTTGYYGRGPVRWHRVSSTDGIGRVSATFEWPGTNDVPIFGPMYLTPRRAYITRGASSEGPAVLQVLDVTPVAGPRVGGQVEIPAQTTLAVDGDRVVGASHTAADGQVRVLEWETTDPMAPVLAPARDLRTPPSQPVGASAKVWTHGGRFWVAATTVECMCSPMKRTRVFALGAGGRSPFVDLEGPSPQLSTWNDGRLVAAGDSTTVLEADTLSPVGAVTVSIPVVSALRVGDDVLRARGDPTGYTLDRVPLGEPDMPAVSGTRLGPEPGRCLALCARLPTLNAAAGGVVAHRTWQGVNESTLDYFERYDSEAAGRQAPASSGTFDLDAEGVRGSGHTWFTAGLAVRGGALPGGDLGGGSTGTLVAIDLVSGPRPAARHWPLVGDNSGPFIADGDQLVTSYTQPRGERVAYFFDRFDYSRRDAPFAAAPINTPGQVVAYDHAAQRILSIESVRRSDGWVSRVHAIELERDRALIRASVDIDWIHPWRVFAGAGRLVAPRLAAESPIRALTVVDGWRAGSHLTVREVEFGAESLRVSEIVFRGDVVVLGSREGLVLVDLRNEAAEVRAFPMATYPTQVHADDRAVLVSLGEAGLRVLPLRDAP